MFDTPSNLTTGNAKPQHGAAAGRRVTRLGKGTARERSRSIIRIAQCDPLVERRPRLPGRPRGDDDPWNAVLHEGASPSLQGQE